MDSYKVLELESPTTTLFADFIVQGDITLNDGTGNQTRRIDFVETGIKEIIIYNENKKGFYYE